MPWWRKLLALLGLTEDARVRVRSAGIEVVITGDPDLVRAVLQSVKAEIAKQGGKRRVESQARPIVERNPTRAPNALAAPALTVVPGKMIVEPSDSNIVLPSDLDEMDSPYAIPEHHTVAPEDPETPIDGTAALSEKMSATISDQTRPDDEPEPELTAIDLDPSGENAVVTVKPQIVSNIDPSTTEEQRPRSGSRAARVKDAGGTDPDL